VTVRARVTEVDGRLAWFELEAEDGQETVARGRHSRAVVDRARFERLIARKRG
jgi:predicted thioesterase